MKVALRFLFYLLGQFILAFGVAFAYYSDMGVSPVNSFPFALSRVIGISPGNCVTLVFCLYVVIQIVMLRGAFKLKDLLQLLFSTIFGWFVNITRGLMAGINVPNYAASLGMLAISIVLIALGLALYLGADIVSMPMEGLGLAITAKLKKYKYHNVKVVLDCASVLVALVILVVHAGGFDIFGKEAIVREGTVITALLAGKVLGLFAKFIWPRMKALKPEPVEGKAGGVAEMTFSQLAARLKKKPEGGQA